MLYCVFIASLLVIVYGSELSNVTCRTTPRSKCFLGRCPTGYVCLSNDECCEESQVVLPPDECQDYLEHCEAVKCDHVDFVDFARANCARTCNFCYENSTLPPEYACTDLLDDCHSRVKLCRDIEFIDFMAVFCPRLCSLCTYNQGTDQCQELVPDCASHENFCTTTKTSEFQKRIGCGKTCGKC